MPATSQHGAANEGLGDLVDRDGAGGQIGVEREAVGAGRGRRRVGRRTPVALERDLAARAAHTMRDGLRAVPIHGGVIRQQHTQRDSWSSETTTVSASSSEMKPVMLPPVTNAGWVLSGAQSLVSGSSPAAL